MLRVVLCVLLFLATFESRLTQNDVHMAKAPRFEMDFTRQIYYVKIFEYPGGKSDFCEPDIVRNQGEMMGVFWPESAGEGRVEYKVVKRSEGRINFVAEPKKVGNFVFLRLRVDQKTAINRESQDVYNLLVTATFHRKYATNIQTRTNVVVQVVDMNDMVPFFSPSEFQKDIQDDLPTFSQVYHVTAIDADVGLNGQIYFSIVSDDGPGLGRDMFWVQASSGVVRLLRPLNADVQSSYELNILARDRSSLMFGRPGFHSRMPDRKFKLTLNVKKANQFPPEIKVEGASQDRLSVFVEPKDFSKNFVAGLIRVMDNDGSSTPNGRVRDVSIIGGNVNHQFFIQKTDESSLYQLVCRKGFLTASDTNISAKITILAVDGGRIPQSSNMTLTWDFDFSAATASIPVFEQKEYHFFVNETVPVNTPLGFVSVKQNLFPGSPLVTYSLEGASDSTKFAINNHTGLVYLAGQLDYELSSTFSLEVAAELLFPSQVNQKLSMPVEITVIDDNDHAPIFPTKRHAMKHFKNESLDTVLYRVAALDRDSENNAKVSYRIIEVEPEFFHDAFVVDAFSGELRLRKKLGPADPDYASVLIRATDSGRPRRRESEMIVDIDFSPGKSKPLPSPFLLKEASALNKQYNQYAPRFLKPWAPGKIQVYETGPEDPSVHRFLAEDDDYGYNGFVQYVLLPDDETSLDDSCWQVDTYSGRLMLVRPLDRERRSKYDLIVTASDLGSPPKATNHSFTIIVLDSNDNPPIFSSPIYVTSVLENVADGRAILEVSATDADEGRNAEVRYTLSAGSGHEDFALDELTGCYFKFLLLIR